MESVIDEGKAEEQVAGRASPSKKSGTPSADTVVLSLSIGAIAPVALWLFHSDLQSAGITRSFWFPESSGGALGKTVALWNTLGFVLAVFSALLVGIFCKRFEKLSPAFVVWVVAACCIGIASALAGQAMPDLPGAGEFLPKEFVSLFQWQTGLRLPGANLAVDAGVLVSLMVAVGLIGQVLRLVFRPGAFISLATALVTVSALLVYMVNVQGANVPGSMTNAVFRQDPIAGYIQLYAMWLLATTLLVSVWIASAVSHQRFYRRAHLIWGYLFASLPLVIAPPVVGVALPTYQSSNLEPVDVALLHGIALLGLVACLVLLPSVLRSAGLSKVARTRSDHAEIELELEHDLAKKKVAEARRKFASPQAKDGFIQDYLRSLESQSKFERYDLANRLPRGRYCKKTFVGFVARLSVHLLALVFWASGFAMLGVSKDVLDHGMPAGWPEFFTLFWGNLYPGCIFLAVPAHLLVNKLAAAVLLDIDIGIFDDIRPIGLLRRDELTDAEQNLVTLFDEAVAECKPARDIVLVINSGRRGNSINYYIERETGTGFVSISPVVLDTANETELKALLVGALANMASEKYELKTLFRECFAVEPVTVAWFLGMSMLEQGANYVNTHGRDGARAATITGAAMGAASGGAANLLIAIVVILCAGALFAAAVPMLIVKAFARAFVSLFESFSAGRKAVTGLHADIDLRALQKEFARRGEKYFRSLRGARQPGFGFEEWIEVKELDATLKSVARDAQWAFERAERMSIKKARKEARRQARQ